MKQIKLDALAEFSDALTKLGSVMLKMAELDKLLIFGICVALDDDWYGNWFGN